MNNPLSVLDASKITSGILALARGGTGADLSGTGGANQIVKQLVLGGAFTVAALVAGDIPAHASTTTQGHRIGDADELDLPGLMKAAVILKQFHWTALTGDDPVSGVFPADEGSAGSSSTWAGSQGAIQLSTGATTNNFRSRRTNDLTDLLDMQSGRARRFSTTFVTDVNPVQVFLLVGMSDKADANGAENNSCSLQADLAAATGNWSLVVTSAGTATTVDTGQAVSNSPLACIFSIRGSSPQRVRLYINGSLVATVTTNIPNVNPAKFRAFVKTKEAVTKNLFIRHFDYVLGMSPDLVA